MKYIKILFAVMALYYALCGVVFSFFPASFFDFFDVTYPNHWSYVHFIGMTTFIYALMARDVAKDPMKNRNLIVYLALVHVFYAIGIFVDSGLFGMPTVWLYTAYASAANSILYFWICYLLGKPASNR